MNDVTYKISYLTGTMELKKGEWKIVPYQETTTRYFLGLFPYQETTTLYALEPDNEYAYIGLRNIDTYENAVIDKAMLEM